MLKLKLQYFGYLMQRTDSLEKTLMLGKTEGRMRRGRQRMRWLDGTGLDGDEFEQALGDGDGQGSLVCCSPRGHRVGHDWLNWMCHQNKTPFWEGISQGLSPAVAFKKFWTRVYLNKMCPLVDVAGHFVGYSVFLPRTTSQTLRHHPFYLSLRKAERALRKNT